MLIRWVVAVWGAWLSLLGLAAVLLAGEVRNPNPILPVGLPLIMLGAGLGLVGGAGLRLIRGPRRDRALAGLLVGTTPLWFGASRRVCAGRRGDVRRRGRSGRLGRPSMGSRSQPSAIGREWFDWYWVAFVLGGLHLAGGSGVALGSRRRERRSPGAG